MTATHSVWLGSEASIWAHRGYRVIGERVQCESREDAEHVVRMSCGDDLAEYDAGSGGVHYYHSQESCDADDDGTGACAVIDEIEDIGDGAEWRA